ncbi:hypothetical protein BT96DRAFT_951001 [Gymnopus androsaceus JB14]|uniref:Uncharacterized protein n=1 Tax=Gymnopus androsaceus JB14 TaxID=1447944 RepID=A0A6A4GEH2_9AGAR|nr:hypothetical protein BT96DRAFT_951001 [Gymnopus androsaceus JB14]
MTRGSPRLLLQGLCLLQHLFMAFSTLPAFRVSGISPNASFDASITISDPSTSLDASRYASFSIDNYQPAFPHTSIDPKACKGSFDWDKAHGYTLSWQSMDEFKEWKEREERTHCFELRHHKSQNSKSAYIWMRKSTFVCSRGPTGGRKKHYKKKFNWDRKYVARYMSSEIWRAQSLDFSPGFVQVSANFTDQSFRIKLWSSAQSSDMKFRGLTLGFRAITVPQRKSTVSSVPLEDIMNAPGIP